MAVGTHPSEESRCGLPHSVVPHGLLSFRERLADLATEYEQLQKKCQALAADNESLREALQVVRGKPAPAPAASESGVAEDECIAASSKEAAKEAAQAKSTSTKQPAEPAAALTVPAPVDVGNSGFPELPAVSQMLGEEMIPTLSGMDAAADTEKLLPLVAKPAEVAKLAEVDGPDNYDQMLLALDRSRSAEPGTRASSAQPSLAIVPMSTALVPVKNGSRKGGESCSSSSSESSSDGSSRGRGGRSRSRRVRRRRKHRHRSRDRRRRGHKDRSRRDRDRERRKSRSRGKKPLANLGNYGSGDHEADVEEFISKNQLEPKVAASLWALKELDRKKIMGTDGGENSFVLIDRVKNPNGVVISRINKLMSGRR